MKKRLISLTFLFFIILPLSARAQTATDGASQLRDSVKQKVDEELSQIKKAVSKKGFLGSITAKNEASLTLLTYQNQTRTVQVGVDSTIKLQNGRDATLADLKIGDYVLAMGDADSQNTLTSSRLLVVPAPVRDSRTSVFATVTKKTVSGMTVSNSNNETSDIKLMSATKYTGQTKSADVKAGSKVLILIKTGTALFIHLFP